MRAPRRRACSSSSRSIAPPPSLSTKPSRSLSHGRLASVGASLRVESAFAWPKLPSPQRVVATSPPPAIIRSASPYWMLRMPKPMACGPDHRGRRGNGHHALRAGELRPGEGALHAQRRSHRGEPPVGPGARRLRAERWGRRDAAGGAAARAPARGAHLRRAGWLWHEWRCLSHHRAPRGRRRCAPGDGERAQGRRAQSRRRAVRQRARDLDPAGRQGRDGRDEARLRRARQAPRRELDQVHDRAPARRRGGGGSDLLGARDPRWCGASHHQLPHARPGVRPGLRPEQRPSHEDRREPLELLRLRRHQRVAGVPALQRLRARPKGESATRAPLVRELDVPPAVLRRLAARFPDRYPLLLDSAASGPLSRVSVLLAEPGAALWLGADGRLGAQGLAPQGTSFLAALESWWLAERSVPRANEQPHGATRLAFEGGWAVFLGYELAQEIEPHLALPRSPLPWAAFALRTPCALVHDLERRRVFAVAEAEAADALARIAREALEAAREADVRDEPLRIERLHEEDPRAYLARVRRAKEYVRAGDIYQANLSRPWEVEIGGAAQAPLAPAAQLYRRLCAANPAPFAALAQWRESPSSVPRPNGWCAS